MNTPENLKRNFSIIIRVGYHGVSRYTFYLWLYGVGHMVKDHSDSQRKPPVATVGYSFQLVARVLLYAHTISHGALAEKRTSSMGSSLKALPVNECYKSSKFQTG